MEDALTAAYRFLLGNSRLLERRLFATCFLGAAATGVVDVLRGYHNEDGGFGHALEPDKRCPASLPIDVETAFAVFVAAGTVDRAMVMRACDFLAGVADEAGAGGAVPLAFPVIESFPRAEHWSDWTFVPGLNPTAGLVGLLYQLGVDHPWLAQGAHYCWTELDGGGMPADAHALSEVLRFLEHTPERDRANEYAVSLAGHLSSISLLRLDPDAPGYGLSPVQLAPTAGSRWRAMFTDAQIGGHLDRLERDQQPDGGWPITWEPPGPAAVLEWRGIVTLEALRTLRSYGRCASTVAPAPVG